MDDQAKGYLVRNNITGQEYELWTRSKWDAIIDACRVEDWKYTAANYSAKTLIGPAVVKTVQKLKP